MKIKIKFRIIVLMLAGSFLYQQAAAQALSFSPTRVYFKGNPGQTVSEVITIHNSSAEPYEFIISLEDWKRDSLGIKEYSPMSTLPNSNAKNITLPATNFQLGPKEKKSFTVSMVIPKAGNPVATNSMLFFTQTNAKNPNMEGNAGIGVKVSLELGVQLFYTPTEAKKGELKFLAFEQQSTTVEQKPVAQLAVKFENTGEIPKDGFIRFELTNKQTGQEIKLKPTPIAIMPLDHQWAYCVLPYTLAAGDYLAVAILDAGGNNDLKVAEKDIHVKK